MTKSTSITSVEIIAIVIQQIALMQTIVVERNVHTYYRMPTGGKINTNLQRHPNNREYHILQCPYRATTDIPLPKDMPICVMVGNYEDNLKDARAKVTPIHVFFSTKVDYKPKKSTEIGMMQRTTSRPYLMKLQPLRVGKKFRASARRPLKGMRYKTRPPKNISTVAEEKSGNILPKEQKSSSTLNFSPLRFLSSFNNFNYLTPDDKAEAYHAALEKYSKGQAIGGYHNMYHRDELQNDHIFYDDLEQRGRFRNYSRQET